MILTFLSSYISQLVKRNRNKSLYKTFGQVLYLASNDRQRKLYNHQDDDGLMLINVPDSSKINRYSTEKRGKANKQISCIP